MPARNVFVTPVFRASFISVFEPDTKFDSGRKYNVTAIVSKDLDGDDKKKLDAIKAEMTRVAKEFFGKDYEKVKKSLRVPFRDGEERENLDGYNSDVMFFRMGTDYRPIVVGRKHEVLDEEDFYAGCYARASITIAAYAKPNKGITFYLNNIQKIKDGPAFGGRSAPENDFEVWDEDDSDDDLF